MGFFKNVSDKNIIEGVRNQDDKTLNWLYDNYLPQVRSYVFNNSGTAEDVSDVFQDSIIVLFTQIKEEKLNLTTDLKGYFFSVARNIWSAKLRKERRTSELEFDPIDAEDSDQLNYLVLEGAVGRAFMKLKPDEQMVLKMFSEGKSYEEIALIMDFKNETYARRKKYLCKEILLDILKEDPEYRDHFRRTN
jgi:RNA polymerase sigma factor (sigma-70 family)